LQEQFQGSLSHPWLSSKQFDPSPSHGLTGRLQPRTLQPSTLQLQPRSFKLQSRELHPT
ncbi:hypothetical protein M9458_012156, partial [Cirrhinus mrigala]